ncbi:MAG: hypothetical protein KatS3mg127_1812 [Silanimonas sp.]|nr:MAG: hypothetical protein KatS3mg127_1812 [Silanimonas sp.]
MNTPTPNAAQPRKLWPWVLGGCLVLVLLAVAALVALGWFGLKMVGETTRQAVAEVPLVQEHFGRVEDVGMDFGGIAEAGQAGQQAMVFRLRGEKGEGRLVITTDPAGGEFQLGHPHPAERRGARARPARPGAAQGPARRRPAARLRRPLLPQ